MADRSVLVTLRANASQFNREVGGASGPVRKLTADLEAADRSTVTFDGTIKDTGSSIDKLSGRLAILSRTAAALGPGLVPITTAMVPALAGLSTQLGFAAAGAGTAVLAFNGVGDSLSALNAYQLERSQANFEKLQETLRGLGPAAREFVSFLDTITPQLQRIRESAQEGLLPGVQEGIDVFLSRAPEVRRIVSEIADASGDLMAGAGTELAGSQWDDFFAFLESEARPALITLGQTVGNLAGGIAELWMAMDPLSDDFTAGLLDASAAFERWAAGLAETEGFADFVAYVRETGPQVVDTLGALGSALIDIGTAVAPLGGPVLAGIEGAARALSAIAESDLGTPIFAAVSAMSALSLATRGWAAVMGSTALTQLKALPGHAREVGTAWAQSAVGVQQVTTASDQARKSLGQLGRTSALIGGVALATSDLGQGLGVTNTASLALMGTFLGPWGTAIGAATGAVMDLSASNDDLAASTEAANAAMADGSIEALRLAIGRLKADMAGGGVASDWWSGLTGETLDAQRALSRMEADLRAAENASGGLASVLAPGLGIAGDAAEDAGMSLDEFRSSLASVNALLERRGSFRAFRDSIRQFAASLEEAPKNMRKFGPAWDKLQGDLDAIGSRALETAEKLKGVNRINFLDKARGEFVAAARQMGMTRREANNLADDLGLLDKQDPKVDFKEQGADRVKGQAKGVKGEVDRIPDAVDILLKASDRASGTINLVAGKLAALDGREARTYITTVYSSAGRQTLGGLQERAGGGLVSGPGGPTDDLISVRLSDGEYVVRTKAVNKYGRHMFDRINSLAFADGGQVRRRGGPADLNSLARDPENRAEIVRILIEIRDLKKALAATGGDVVVGLERKRTQAELAAAVKDLREARGQAAEDRADAAKERREAAAERRRTIREGVRAFDLVEDEATPGGDVRAQFRDLAKVIRQVKGQVPDSFDRLADRGARLADRIAEWESKVEESRRSLEGLIAEQDSFKASVAGSFDNDIFGKGVDGLLLQLEADANDANAMTAALQSLIGLGLNGEGGLFRELAVSGDLFTAQSLVAGGAGLVGRAQGAFDARAAAQGGLAGFAGEQAFGREVARMEAAVVRQEQALVTMTSRVERIQREAVREYREAVERGTERGAARGTRDGMAERDRNTNQRARAGR